MIKHMFHDSSRATLEEAYQQALGNFKKVGDVNNELLLEKVEIPIGRLIGQCIGIFKNISNRKRDFQMLIANNDNIIDTEKINATLDGFDVSTNNMSSLIESLKSISTELGYKKPETEDETEDDSGDLPEKTDTLGDVDFPEEDMESDELPEFDADAEEEIQTD